MALQGTLETFTVPDVLRLLASTKKSGLFTLEGDRGSGRVWLSAGSVAGADSDREGGGGVDAVMFDLLRFSEGSFSFEPDLTAPEDVAVSEGDVEEALEHAEQLLEEWREIESVIPSMDAWVRLTPALTGDSVTIDAELWKVLAVIGGGSTGRRVGIDLGLGELDSCRTLRDLVELGVAEVDPDMVVSDVEPAVEPAVEHHAPPPPPPPPPPGFVDEAVVVDHDLTNDEVASLGANLAGFMARPSESDADADLEHDNEPDPVDVEASPIEDEFVTEDSHGIEFGEAPERPEAEVAETFEPVEMENPDEFLSQLANLSPKAAAAIEAIDGSPTDEADQTDQSVAEMDDSAPDDSSDEEINKNLLLKFLSSAKN